MLSGASSESSIVVDAYLVRADDDPRPRARKQAAPGSDRPRPRAPAADDDAAADAGVTWSAITGERAAIAAASGARRESAKSALDPASSTAAPTKARPPSRLGAPCAVGPVIAGVARFERGFADGVWISTSPVRGCGGKGG